MYNMSWGQMKYVARLGNKKMTFTAMTDVSKYSRIGTTSEVWGSIEGNINGMKL